MATQMRLTHVLLEGREFLPIVNRQEVDDKVDEILRKREALADELGLVGIIDGAPVLAWSVHEETSSSSRVVDGFLVTVAEREIWFRYRIGNDVLGAEKARTIWAAVALSFSPGPSTSEVSADAAVRNLRKRIGRSGR